MPLPYLVLEGRLTSDPDLRFTPGGHAVCGFTLACSDRKRNPVTDEWEDAGTLFIRVNVWRQLAENVAESVVKGDLVLVYGKLQQRDFETKEGDRRSVFEITASQVAAAMQFRTIKHGERHKKEGDATPQSEPEGAPF